MHTYNYYKIYGLIVKSQIEIHEKLLLEEIPTNFDVEVRLDDIKDRNFDTYFFYGPFRISSMRSFFDIEDVGCYEVSNGSLILVQAYSSSTKEDLTKYVIGSALGLLLQQRNILAIHGGSVVIDDIAVIISGCIGAGKTSTLSTLVNKGYGFLSDDVSSIIKDKSNNYNVHHCTPHQKYCKNTAEASGIDTNCLYEIDTIKNKYLSPEINNFVMSPKRLKCIFYLYINDGDTVKYSEIFGADKLNIVMSNIYRKEILPTALFDKDYIKNCILLCSKVSVYKISRPKNKYTTNEIVEIIELLTKGDECYVKAQ